MTRNLLHSKASNLRHLLRNFAGGLKFRLLRVACLILNPKIALTYDASVKPDGVGAQLQRILAIRSLAKNLNISYLHTPISSVAIHPLDPYQTQEEMKEFLDRLNSKFYMASDQLIEKSENFKMERPALTFPLLAGAIIRSFVKRKMIFISCAEPYSVSEFDLKKFDGISEFLPNFAGAENENFKIAIHIRWGVGGMAIQKGEKISRQITLDYYVKLLESILLGVKGDSISVTIFTDAPSKDVEFRIPSGQKDLWENSTSVNGDTMSVIGLDVENHFSRLGIEPQIVRGGDPLWAITEMANSDVLIMSRSSFSYVAGILNEGQGVYYPSSFWHKPLKNWHVMRES